MHAFITGTVFENVCAIQGMNVTAPPCNAFTRVMSESSDTDKEAGYLLDALREVAESGLKPEDLFSKKCDPILGARYTFIRTYT